MKNPIVIADANNRENKVCAAMAIIMPREISKKYKNNNTKLPINPHSSENTAKIKSVCFSGINSKCVCVPFKNPLPESPPEPMAMVD